MVSGDVKALEVAARSFGRLKLPQDDTQYLSFLIHHSAFIIQNSAHTQD